MTASAFLVKLPSHGGYTLADGCDAVICWADSSAQALDIASAASGVDSKGSMWAGATAVPLIVGTKLDGWTAKVDIVKADFSVEYTASYTATAGQVTDDIGTGLAAALIVAGVAGATYNTSTNLLTIAASTDNLGAYLITVGLYPPAAAVDTNTVAFGDTANAVSGFFGAVTVPNVTAATARTSTLVATFPSLYGMARMKR